MSSLIFKAIRSGALSSDLYKLYDIWESQIWKKVRRDSSCKILELAVSCVRELGALARTSCVTELLIEKEGGLIQKNLNMAQSYWVRMCEMVTKHGLLFEGRVKRAPHEFIYCTENLLAFREMFMRFSSYIYQFKAPNVRTKRFRSVNFIKFIKCFTLDECYFDRLLTVFELIVRANSQDYEM